MTIRPSEAFLTTLLALGFGCKGRPAQVLTSDTRQPLALPPEAQDAVRAEMNGMLTSLNRILVALPQRDTATIRQAAAASGLATAADPTLEKLLPEQFLAWGTQTHQKFDELAASLTSTSTPDSVLARLGAITQICVTCHATYRLAVDDHSRPTVPVASTFASLRRFRSDCHPASSSYRLQLTRLAHRVVWGRDTPPCPGRLAETRLGLEPLQGR